MFLENAGKVCARITVGKRCSVFSVADGRVPWQHPNTAVGIRVIRCQLRPNHGTAIQQLPIIIKHNRPNERGNGSPHITYELYDVNMLLNAAVFRYSNSATAVSCRGPAGEPRWPLRNSWRGCKVYATNILPSSCGLRTANRPDVLNVSTLPCLSQSSSVTKELKGWRKGRPFCARD